MGGWLLLIGEGKGREGKAPFYSLACLLAFNILSSPFPSSYLKSCDCEVSMWSREVGMAKKAAVVS